MPESRCLIRVGHRGAGAYAPDNTVASFLRALEIGVDMIETDVRLSRDGELVLAHDDELGPKGRRLSVAKSDWPELRERRLDVVLERLVFRNTHRIRQSCHIHI